MKPPFDAKEYQKEVAARAPKSPALLQCVKAFLVGGLICVLGQGIHDLALLIPLSDRDASTVSSMTLIFLTALLTGIGVFDRIASFAGAGTVVPITGFANSIAAPAMEYRPEGFVLGIGAKMFTIAGPVLVYGIGASIIVGLISLLL
ncbi:MAG: stage V sporulation protein AC [Clostridia bacterium]|nr:stage V sporulation protein AC [Clostridia bacterium]